LRSEDLDARFPGLLDCVLKAAEHADLLSDADRATLDSVVAASAAADAPESPVVA
jgi:hypothetical protein